MLARLFGLNDEEYPPDKPVEYGPQTFEEFMANASWELRDLAMHGTFEHTEAQFDWLMRFDGNMTECAATLLSLPDRERIVLDYSAKLMARGVNVAALYLATAQAREARGGVTDEAVYSELAHMALNHLADGELPAS